MRNGAEIKNDHNLLGFSVGNGVEILSRIIKKGASANVLQRAVDVALHTAVQKGDKKITSFLMEKGANVNFKRDNGYTPLHWIRDIKIASILIKNGADINALDDNGDTPLHWTSRRFQRELTEFLIKNGADINAKNKCGATPLFIALWGSVRNCEKILTWAQGFYSDIKYNSWNKRCDTVSILIKHKADIHATAKRWGHSI